ncbi:MAG TPA: inositol monophosphatase family protein [Cryomorphaceae bacterium]|nr:inositol monophosphatase family protein [Cryomorphaceae bacterium]
MSKTLDSVVEISRSVGSFLKSEQEKILATDIEMKGRSNDLVSRADKEAEKRFVTFLANLYPDSGFIAEEGTSEKKGEELNWIIDPLDGTTNYLYGIPCYCTSVALVKNGELILGVIYDPEMDACFTAEKGQGAFLNGKKISVSSQENIAHALIATGFPYDDADRQRIYLDILGEVNRQTRGIRRLGSAALDMAYVACGRFDAFYEYGLQPWDVAAGAIIIREAGGVVSDFKGGDEFLFGRTLACSNKSLHGNVLGFLKDW